MINIFVVFVLKNFPFYLCEQFNPLSNYKGSFIDFIVGILLKNRSKHMREQQIVCTTTKKTRLNWTRKGFNLQWKKKPKQFLIHGCINTHCIKDPNRQTQ